MRSVYVEGWMVLGEIEEITLQGGLYLYLPQAHNLQQEPGVLLLQFLVVLAQIAQIAGGLAQAFDLSNSQAYALLKRGSGCCQHALDRPPQAGLMKDKADENHRDQQVRNQVPQALALHDS
jgi:hypothetical protein